MSHTLAGALKIFVRTTSLNIALAVAWAQSSVGNSPSFEVASVKRSSTNPTADGIRVLPGGRFEATGVTVTYLIQYVFDLREFQILGSPKWANDWSTGRYDIQAKAADPSTDAGHLRLMARALLEARFHLRSHIETRRLTVYSVVEARDGPRVTLTPVSDQPAGAGAVQFLAKGSIKGTNVMMETLVRALSTIVDRPVVDHTRLRKAFDFKLLWGPEEDPGNGPSIFTAIHEQLGFKLVLQRAPIDVLVIDAISRPEQN